ncbi:MAG: hypothetical protein ABI700_11540 [Chloroflexota bacterium]
MKSIYKLLILVACLLLPVIAFAQDASASQTVDLDDGYSIVVPADWQITKNNDGVFMLAGDTLRVTVTTPTRLKALNFNFTAADNAVDVLLAVPMTVNPLTKSDVKKALYDDRQAAVYTNLSSDFADQQVVALLMSDDSFGFLSFTTAKGQLAAQQIEIDAIIASFDSSTSAGGGTGGGTGRSASIGGTTSNGSNASTGGASEVNCTVSAESADAAQLRVGPGTNRGAISFLPANVDVTVTGRIVLSDKSVWYQLDKKEAAPKGTAAAELWVSAESVTASGDCDHVGETSAPPVIPGNIAPPPATNNNGGSGSGDQGSANSAPGSLPTAGTWNMTINATTNASCAGYENVPIPSTEVFDSLTYTFGMFIVNGNSFNYGQDVFTRIPGTNSFSGSFTFDDGTNAQIRFDLRSPTSMFGQAVTNFTQDGVACSATSLFLTNHR